MKCSGFYIWHGTYTVSFSSEGEGRTFVSHLRVAERGQELFKLNSGDGQHFFEKKERNK